MWDLFFSFWDYEAISNNKKNNNNNTHWSGTGTLTDSYGLKNKQC